MLKLEQALKEASAARDEEAKAVQVSSSPGLRFVPAHGLGGVIDKIAHIGGAVGHNVCLPLLS